MKRKITLTRIFLVSVLVLLAMVVPAAPSHATTVVNLVLLPSNQSVGTGSTFTIVVQAQCGTQTMDGTDVFLDFNPNHLAVQSAVAGTTLTMITMSPAFNNTLGTFKFGAGITSPFPSGNFTVVTITFQAISASSVATSIAFHASGDRLTMVDMGGNSITGSLVGATVNIINDIPLYLDPASVSSVCSGQTFNLAIKTNTGSSQQVSGVQAYLYFDPSRLEVVDADSATTGIQITPGSSFDYVLENTVDNSIGLISYAAGKLGSPFPYGSFTVASIQFRAKTVTDDVTTQITFSLSGPGTNSMVDYTGTAIAGTHANATVSLISGANVEISANLQGGSRPDNGYAVPLTVKFFTPGISTPVDVMTATPVYTFNLTTAKNGAGAEAQASGVVPGVYDISVASEHCLCNVKRGVVITAPDTIVDMGTLLEGDANGDHVVNIQDFGLLAGTYGKSSGVAGYNAMANFDRNGIVNIADFGLLAGNYGKRCPQTVSVSSGGGGGGGG